MKKIAKEFGISSGTVYNRLKKYPEVKIKKEEGEDLEKRWINKNCSN